MKRILTSLAVTAAVLLAPFGCRRDPPPPAPRLIGTPGPTATIPAPEDQLGIGGSGAEGESTSVSSDGPTVP